MNKILTIHIKLSNCIYIHKSHTSVLNKWPFSYYKTCSFNYPLNFISYINKNDLIYMLNNFEVKLNKNQLHKSALKYEKNN